MWRVSLHCTSLLLLVLLLQNTEQSNEEGQEGVAILVRTQAFRSGESLSLKCSVDDVQQANSSGVYFWRRDSEQIELNERIIQRIDGTLTINSVSMADQGYYQCFYETKFGTFASSSTSALVLATVRTATETSVGSIANISSDWWKVNAREPLRLPCESIDSVPTAFISWTRSQENMPYPVVMERNNRVQQDAAGNLYFTHVLHSDATKRDSYYTCRHYNAVLKFTHVGAEHKVRVISNNGTRAVAPTILYSEPEVTALEGRNATLWCLASGYPSPAIVWHRFSTITGNFENLVSTRATPENFGYNLLIRQVTIEDGGKYRCVARNRESSASATVVLTVERAPVWIRRPVDEHVEAGESLTLRCDANGIPHPVVKWLVDGRECAAPDCNVSSDANVSSLTLLRVERDRVVQCNASNRHGYLFRNIRVIVDVRPPVIGTEATQLRVSVTENDVAVLPCVVAGMAPRSVRWHRNGRQLPINDRRITQRDADLLIANVTLRDRAVYECTVSSRYGDMTGRVALFVYQRVTGSIAPRSVTVIEGEQVSLVCVALVSDLADVDVIQLSWLHFGRAIDTGADLRFSIELSPSELASTLTISNISAADAGDYVCLRNNGVVNATEVARVEVRSRPAAPSVVRCLCQDRRAVIYWLGGVTCSTIKHSVVEYRLLDLFADGVWAPAETNTTIISSTNCTFQSIAALGSNLRYALRVRAMNEIGSSAADQSAGTVCRTPPSAPERHPLNVATGNGRPATLVVQWEPLEFIEQNGPQFAYYVDVMCLECSDLPVSAKDMITTVVVQDYRASNVSIEFLRANGSDIPVPIYRRFQVRVWSFNVMGSASDMPPWTTGYSSEDVPTVAPGRPVVKVVWLAVQNNSCLVSIMWTLPAALTPPTIRGHWVGCRVRWWQLSVGGFRVHENYHDVPRSACVEGTSYGGYQCETRLSIVTDGFSLHRKVSFAVSVINLRNEGDYSAESDLLLTGDAPPPCRNLALVRSGIDFLQLRWDSPVPLPDAIDYHFVVRFFPTPTAYSRAVSLTERVTTALSIQLTGLLADTPYTVQVVAVNNDKEGQPVTVTAATAPGEMLKIRTNALNQSSVSITVVGAEAWRHCVTTFYYKRVNDGPNSTFTISGDCGRLPIVINNLSSSQTYEVYGVLYDRLAFTVRRSYPSRFVIRDRPIEQSFLTSEIALVATVSLLGITVVEAIILAVVKRNCRSNLVRNFIL